MPGRRVDTRRSPVVGSHAPPNAVDRLVLRFGHGAGQAESLGTTTAPLQRRLAPGRVVLQRLAGVVVVAPEHGGAVVVDGAGAHHAHERHAGEASSAAPEGLQSCKKLLPLSLLLLV